MSFRDIILYSYNTLIVEELYNALLLKEKMKHRVGSEAQGNDLVVHGSYERGSSKSNFD